MVNIPSFSIDPGGKVPDSPLVHFSVEYVRLLALQTNRAVLLADICSVLGDTDTVIGSSGLATNKATK
jgi:hypothetical protein